MALMDRLIQWSLHNRLFVVIAAMAITAYGTLLATQMPVDVFPDLTAPTVTVLTEAHGLAPQEVETLVTFPIESAVNGATGVRRVRSASGVGISVIWIEFDWSTDIYIARQVVNEKLQLVASQIPSDIGPPTLAPISSVMGEILFLSLKSDRHGPLEVRETADWVLRKRLLSIPGVAQVVPIGGGVKQFQVLLEPERMLRHGIALDEVVDALEESNQNSTGGFYVQGAQESLIRGVGRIASARDIERTVVALRGGVPIRIEQVAAVVVGPGIQRGQGSSNAEPAVILGVLKQPGANTLELTARIDQHLDQIQRALPEGMAIDRHIFRQANFIETAIHNVSVALRDGAVLVALILFLFLYNARTTLISLAALPVSLLVAVFAIRATGSTINTMTLGGLTIAIGALVDDAVIDVENVLRRLRENHQRQPDQRRPVRDVIYEASREVRAPIVYATLIIILVFLPLFFLSGVEGRLLYPLGFAYVVALFASLVVALTLTPALCSYLLSTTRSLAHGDAWFLRWLKAAYRPSLRLALRWPWPVMLGSLALFLGTLAAVPFLGRTFLPDFNEGSLTISAVTLPGTSLAESDRMGRRVEQILLAVPEVAATARRTGRAELDEHAQDVNAAEIDVRLAMQERSKDAVLEQLRQDLAAIPGMVITIGQPISHRIDHMLSGTRANIAIKLFGDDLYRLRVLAEQIRTVMADVDGVVDLSVEQQVDIPQLAITFDRDRLARYGLRTGAVAEAIETAYAGHEIGAVLQGQRTYPLVVRYADAHRADVDAIRNTLIDAPDGSKLPLKMVADIRHDVGPNFISRENVQRKIVIMANVAGRDIRGVIDDIRAGLDARVELPEGYYVEYGGQFESEQEATRTILLLGILVVAGIFLLLYLAFRSIRSTLIVMVNLPLALIGGVAAVYLQGGILSVASLVGFITLFGIATRNGLMMVSHYETLMRDEGASFEEAIERGSQERLSPILMTALSAGLALIPLVLAGSAPGNEIQAPMGVVIVGGLITSTALNMVLLPVLYATFGRAPVK